ISTQRQPANHDIQARDSRLVSSKMAFLEAEVKVEQSSSRGEAAWARFNAWARKWHQVTEHSYFAGTLGGASLAQVYFADVSLNSLQKFLASMNAETLTARCQKSVDAESSFGVNGVSGFLKACEDLSNEDCYLVASLKVPLTTRIFECNTIVERLRGVTVDVDVKMGWVPLLAFFNARDLKSRFLEIFEWFFSVQEGLQARAMLLCLEYCQNPRTDTSDWIEI